MEQQQNLGFVETGHPVVNERLAQFNYRHWRNDYPDLVDYAADEFRKRFGDQYGENYIAHRSLATYFFILQCARDKLRSQFTKGELKALLNMHPYGHWDVVETVLETGRMYLVERVRYAYYDLLPEEMDDEHPIVKLMLKLSRLSLDEQFALLDALEMIWRNWNENFSQVYEELDIIDDDSTWRFVTGQTTYNPN